MANQAQVNYTANMGMQTISTANTNLDGAGTITTVITGAANGTLIKNLIVKAQSDTVEGMIRIYAKKSGGSNRLISEYCVPAINISGRDISFMKIVSLNYTLEANEELRVSTERANTFSVIGEAFDISYVAVPSYVGNSLEYSANSGAGLINAANPNRDGTGTMTQIFTAGASGSGFLGCEVRLINIKALASTSPGMVRLFLEDSGGGGAILFYEVAVPDSVQNGTTKSFEHQVIGVGSLCIPPGYSIWAATELSEPFSIVIEGQDWKYI